MSKPLIKKMIGITTRIILNSVVSGLSLVILVALANIKINNVLPQIESIAKETIIK